MKITPPRYKAAFTLVELLVVMTIILILAGIVAVNVGYVNDNKANAKAKVQIALLTTALENYKNDMAVYPATGNTATGLSQTPTLYQALFYEGYQYTSPTTPPSGWTKATRIYCADLNPVTSKQGWVTKATSVSATSSILDPWGHEYRYRSAFSGAATPVANASTQNPDFDLWSMGKDGKTNPGTPSDTVNLDDIKNF